MATKARNTSTKPGTSTIEAAAQSIKRRGKAKGAPVPIKQARKQANAAAQRIRKPAATKAGRVKQVRQGAARAKGK